MSAILVPFLNCPKIVYKITNPKKYSTGTNNTNRLDLTQQISIVAERNNAIKIPSYMTRIFYFIIGAASSKDDGRYYSPFNHEINKSTINNQQHDHSRQQQQQRLNNTPL